MCKKIQQSDDLCTRLEALSASNCMKIRLYEFKLLSTLAFKWPYRLKRESNSEFSREELIQSIAQITFVNLQKITERCDALKQNTTLHDLSTGKDSE